MMSRRLALVCLLIATPALAQKPPEFEVASIKPTPEGTNPTAATVGLRITGSNVRISGLSLKDYIGMAYSLEGRLELTCRPPGIVITMLPRVFAPRVTLPFPIEPVTV